MKDGGGDFLVVDLYHGVGTGETGRSGKTCMYKLSLAGPEADTYLDQSKAS